MYDYSLQQGKDEQRRGRTGHAPYISPILGGRSVYPTETCSMAACRRDLFHLGAHRLGILSRGMALELGKTAKHIHLMTALR